MRPAWINRLFKRPAPALAGLSALAPAERFYAIGDIHGRMDLLDSLLVQLDQSSPIVFVGDYVDRGENSAQVLRYLHNLSSTGERRITCLLGNHEEMLLQFLDLPEQSSRIWLRNGGLQTLTSFGIGGISEILKGECAVAIADNLREEMGEALLTWLYSRPLTWTSGNVTAVHAALDPARPVEHQYRQTCLWGHRLFTRTPREDGQWVIHGHTIMPEPRASNGVISIDTGAFATGRLTAAEISSGSVRFISTG